jgi:photosystem II stability/assembly factor-like uncharacterized protein
MRRRFGVTCIVSIALASVTAFGQLDLFNLGLTEFQPDIVNGGRANTIAVHPTNNDVIFVASETGGLFRSSDHGTTWKHVDGLPEYVTPSVAFVPADPNILIATVGDDTRVANGGGIWRSADGGSTWRHITNPPMPRGVSARFQANDITIAPDTGKVFVATTYGVGISSDQGVTWTYVDAFGGKVQPVYSVLAQGGNHLLAGGSAGVRRSPDSGTTWFSPATPVGATDNIHAFAGSPFAQNQAYLVNSSIELYYTEDGGDHWTKIGSAPAGGGGCGGIGFVKAVGSWADPSPGHGRQPIRNLNLYFGNHCDLFKLSCSAIIKTNRFSYSGTWSKLKIDHSDTRDLAFDKASHPLLLATDGGLHATTDGGANWALTGGGHNGYDALQITEVRGQWIDDIKRHDLYFGTQDNNLYSSGDGGATWNFGTCCEGFFIEGRSHVPTTADSQITFVACSGCNNFLSGSLFSGISTWKNPDGSGSNPKIIGKSFHVQGAAAGASLKKGLAVTEDLGATWQQYATFAEDLRDLPKLTRYHIFLPVLYQSVRTGWDAARNFEIDHLVRISESLFPVNVKTTYPTMNNFGGLGINPTMFAWYQVFAVDPGDSAYIIAPDVVNEKMMETRNSGNDWTEIPNLTSLVTDNGRLLFRKGIFPQVSAISFSYDNPNLVAIGTVQGGIFLSDDHGAAWSKVAGSDAVTYITAIDWRSPTDLVVSTYGRGLWRIHRVIHIPLPNFSNLGAVLHPIPPDPGPLKLQNAVLVFDGRIQGARLSDGTLEELLIEPGASVALVSDSKEPPKFRTTETREKVGFTQAAWTSRLREERNLVGFALTEDNKVAGIVTSESELKTHEAEPKPTEELVRKAREDEARESLGSEVSPTAKKPYVQMSGPPDQPNLFLPGKIIRLSGRDFPAQTQIEVLIDENVVGKTVVNGDHVFQLTVTAPSTFGIHHWTVRDAKTRKVIDGAMFLISHEDRASPRDNKPK